MLLLFCFLLLLFFVVFFLLTIFMVPGARVSCFMVCKKVTFKGIVIAKTFFCCCFFKGCLQTIYIWFTCFMISKRNNLRAISVFVHAHHSCGGKRGKLSGSRLSTIFKFASKRFHIRLRLVDVSTFSGQKSN